METGQSELKLKRHTCSCCTQTRYEGSPQFQLPSTSKRTKINSIFSISEELGGGRGENILYSIGVLHM